MISLRKLLVITLIAVVACACAVPAFAQSKLLSENVKITKCADAAGAATTDVTGATIDMAGWDGVLFVTSYGTAAADNLIHVEQGAASTMSDAADLAGGEIDLSGASDEDQWIDLYQPRERYVRCIAVRGTSSTLENLWAIQYRGKSRPVTNLTSGTIYGKRVIRPAEGTK